MWTLPTQLMTSVLWRGRSGTLIHVPHGVRHLSGGLFPATGPLIDRLAHMGGTTTAREASLSADPLTTNRDQGWVASVFLAHQAAVELQASFTIPELLTIGPIAPRGNIIQSVGDTRSVVTDLPPTGC